MSQPADARVQAGGDDAAPAAIAVERLTHHYPAARRRKAGRESAAPNTDSQSAPAPRPALDDVSLRVAPGTIFGILGPNGGGKTTLFRILATLLTPNAGRSTTKTGSASETGSARIFGHDVQRDPAAVRRALGVVFQQPSLDGKLTARENLVHQGRLYGLHGRDLHARIDKWLQRFALLDRADEYTERFSGGMRRRVELAKALLHEPRLLLMDEPATGLDPGARREMWQHLQRLRDEQGVTVALTTHLMEEAERCDRLAILARGRCIALDSPANLKAAVGADVVTVEPAPHTDPDAPQHLAQQITERFGPWADEARGRPRVVDGCVRFEKPDGTALVTDITRAWPDQVRRISVGQPTLEDVFLDRTGAAFHDEPDA